MKSLALCLVLFIALCSAFHHPSSHLHRRSVHPVRADAIEARAGKSPPRKCRPHTTSSATHKATPKAAAAKTTTTSTKAKPKPKPTPHAAPAAVSGGNSGGVATYFYQKGNAGACGTVHSDDAMICAMDSARYQASNLCGKQVRITNKNNGKTIVVTVADECPTCINSNSIDLSLGAFTQIATIAEGQVPIVWEFV